ncbi:MAG: T9SS type A sorting domain-containing protein [Nanoarchaeota archaeon]|nr:T9SS type A sorting domain-containing protein [Nanoarchaeota archaeon]MBU1644542.1 T9SS type A sorting domain-containing protein [Nanoarchaeota archaeon]MBU1976835.1 T9SS type A sorting domain-containing protein [Nanoarchaeota archaeon]
MDKAKLRGMIISNIHDLVKIIDKTERKKVLKHYWYLNRMFVYPTYEFSGVEEVDEFIVRLSFFCEGIRNRLKLSENRSDEIKEIKKVYRNVFLTCVYNFEPKKEIKELTQKFHDLVENYFKNDVLGCILGISVKRFWLFKIKQKKYELVETGKVIKSGKTSKEGIIAFENIKKGNYILKIYFDEKVKEKKIQVTEFLSGIKLNFI